MTEEASGTPPPFADLLAKGVQIVGAGVGAGLGLLVSPDLMVPGAMAAQALVIVGTDFAYRMLSDREKARVGGVLAVAADALVERQVQGRTIRNDDFFSGERSTFDEVVEGVLLSARSEHQEKKIPYLGNLIASIATDPAIDINLANTLIDTSERLSWLQLQIIAMISRPVQFPLPDHDIHTKADNWSTYAVLKGLSQLGMAQEELVFCPRLEPESGLLPMTDLRMSSLQLSSMGLLLAETMQLEKVPTSELGDVHVRLGEAPASS